MRLITFLFIIINSITVLSQDITYTIDTIQINSNILAENRSIIIYRPKDLSDSETVRFIYFLDGENSGFRYQSIYKQFQDTISDLIAVGIVNTDRRRDLLYAFGADKFMDFISTELIPAVEKDYRTKSRILFGHSFAGSFTLYTLIKRPGTFDGYIVSSPTPIMDLVDKENYINMDRSNAIKLCLSFGSEDMKQVKKWTSALNDNLSSLDLKNLDWSFQVFDGRNHNNSDIPSLINGLRMIYCGIS